MLEEPSLPLSVLSAAVLDAYALQPAELTFLPLGADSGTAVYRLVASDNSVYFLKLRSGPFDEISVSLPHYLHEQGLRQVIPPLPERRGQLFAKLVQSEAKEPETYRMILYPFIEGVDGYQRELTDAQWEEFGAAVKRLHSTALPASLAHQVRRESFAPLYRNRVKGYQARAEMNVFDDPTAVRLAALMRQKEKEINLLLSRAERLASELQACDPELVLCHSDLHAGNLHLTPGGGLYIVDWDAPVFAPKEHDLMHIGASARWMGRRIKGFFYRGYGEVQVDGMALVYYRCERILQDIAAFCAQLLDTQEGGKDREQSYTYFSRQFEPGQEVEIATRGGDEKQLRFYGCFPPRKR